MLVKLRLLLAGCFYRYDMSFPGAAGPSRCQNTAFPGTFGSKFRGCAGNPHFSCSVRSCLLLDAVPVRNFSGYDFVAGAAEKKNRQKFHYRKERRRLRYGILLMTAAALFSGLALLPVLLDPYSIYGRMVTHLLTPIWQQSVNGAAALGEQP